MVPKIINYLKSGFTHPLTQILLKILTITSITSTCITVGGLFFYSIGYSFLYGYYFFNIENENVSLITLLTSNVPFSFYSVIITSVIFLTVVVFFVILLWNIGLGLKHVFTKGFRTLGFIRIFLIIFIFFIFHFSLTSFFVSSLPSMPENANKFFYVWVVPFAVALLIYCMIQIEKGIFSALAGTCYGMLIVSISSSVLDYPPSAILALAIFAIAIPFSYFEKFLKFGFYRFFLSLPFSSIIVMLLSNFFHYTYPKTMWWLLISIIVVLSIIISFATKKLVKDKKDSNELSDEEINNNKKSNKESIKKFNISTFLTLFIIAVLSFTATTIPSMSKTTGSLFRFVTPSSPHQNIYYDGSNTPQLNNVELVAQKDDLYYISNSESRMIILKTDKIRIEYPTDKKKLN